MGVVIWPSQGIRNAISRGVIRAERPVEPAQIQPASLDLRLGDRAYRVPASFLPGPGRSMAARMTPREIALRMP